MESYMAMADNRRRFNRKYLTFFARITDRQNGRVLGYLVDLTSQGALMVGDLPLVKGEVFTLRMDLPEGFVQGNCLDLDAKAVWSGPDIEPNFYRTGLQLMNLSSQDTGTLERLLAEYCLAQL